MMKFIQVVHCYGTDTNSLQININNLLSSLRITREKLIDIKYFQIGDKTVNLPMNSASIIYEK